MDAVRADEDISLDRDAAAVRAVERCAVTGCASSTATKRWPVWTLPAPEPRPHRAKQRHLQHAAMDRDLRHRIAGKAPARLAQMRWPWRLK